MPSSHVLGCSTIQNSSTTISGNAGGCSILSIFVRLDKGRISRKTAHAMATNADSPYDLLWQEYGLIFRDFDDLSLARWMAQTLGQFEGKVWRLSHPLVGAYRLACQEGNHRQIWLKRLATPPAAYAESPCCRAPALPLLTRDVQDSGLVCPHCNEVLVTWDEIPAALKDDLSAWTAEYKVVHAVAHWDEAKQASVGSYEQAYEQAARRVERLLVQAGSRFAPELLDYFPAVIWEDQDDCLEVRPEDVTLGRPSRYSPPE
jgi:uncharacterized protein YbaR (Trm112 family)